MHESRMAHEVWQVIKDQDWVLTAGTLKNWALKIWDFDAPYRHPGRELGTATQIGISLGVALAHKGGGKLVVDLQPDGDLLYVASSLWTAVHHELPMLIVLLNNKAYYTDFWLTKLMAEQRGRSSERAEIGNDIDNPVPDYVKIAESYGAKGIGPITEPDQLGTALKEAVTMLKDSKTPVLVDVATERSRG